MVSAMTATIVLIALVAVMGTVLVSSMGKNVNELRDSTNDKIKLGYIIDGNRLTIVDITGNVPVPPGMIKINPTDNANVIPANVMWIGKNKYSIQAGTSITNNLNQKINLKVFYDNYPVIDASLGPGSDTPGSSSASDFVNGTCNSCNANGNTISFSS